MTLKQLCAKYYNNGWPDKDTVHSYIDIYEDLLAPYRTTAKNILEVGLFSGESLKMWEEYFADGIVSGIDISDTPHGGLADLRPMIEEGTHNIHIFDATNENEIKKRFGKVKFDVIIDDAAHSIEQQLELYEKWKSKLSPNGIYIIEDIQDIDKDRKKFENLNPDKTIGIIDLRHVKNRYDDVLVIIHPTINT